jgi:hypothetical protein
MMQLNTPGQADGRMAFWIDGQPALEVQGMRWRDIPELQLNKAWLMHYIAAGDAEQSNPVWFDDMVVSREYIGCAGGLPEPTVTDAPPPSATPVGPTPGEPTRAIPTPVEPTPGVERWWNFLPSLRRAQGVGSLPVDARDDANMAQLTSARA